MSPKNAEKNKSDLFIKNLCQISDTESMKEKSKNNYYTNMLRISQSMDVFQDYIVIACAS